MDPLSITATCIGLASTTARTSLAIISFIKDVRDARSDLDTVSRELHSLKTVLDLLADDCNDSTHKIPQTLQKQISGIITNCTGVVEEIEKTLKKHEGSKLNKAAKWVASGKTDVLKLQSSLEAHKSALDIALDMVKLTLTREIKADTQELLNDTSAIKVDTAQILAEIVRLQEKLPRDTNQYNAGFMLERYLDNLTSYAETVCDPFSDGLDESRGSERGSIEQQWSVPTSRPRSRASSSENEPTPQTISLNSPKPHLAGSLISMITSSPAATSRESGNQLLEARVEGSRRFKLSPNNQLDITATSIPASAQGGTLDEEVATLEIRNDVLSNNIGASSRQSATSLPRNSNANPRSSSSTGAPAAARTFWASLAGRTSKATTKKPRKFKLFKKLKGHSGGVTSVAFSPDGHRLASGHDDSTIRIWADRQGRLEQVQELAGDYGGVSSVAFSPDGRWLASCSYRNSKILIWADRQGRLEQEQELAGDSVGVSSVAFSPDGRRLVSGNFESIQIWADRQGRLEQVQQELAGRHWNLFSHSYGDNAVSFSPDGHRLASSGHDSSSLSTIRIWADRQGRLEKVQELADGLGWVASVAFSSDGRWLASGKLSGMIRIWADRQGRLEQVQELAGGLREVGSIAFSPDGRWLASCSYDGTVRIWVERQGRFEQVQELARHWYHSKFGHFGMVSSVAFSPDGQWLANGHDGIIRIWKVEN